jgi:hypothetical protein
MNSPHLISIDKYDLNTSHTYLTRATPTWYKPYLPVRLSISIPTRAPSRVRTYSRMLLLGNHAVCPFHLRPDDWIESRLSVQLLCRERVECQTKLAVGLEIIIVGLKITIYFESVPNYFEVRTTVGMLIDRIMTDLDHGPRVMCVWVDFSYKNYYYTTCVELSVEEENFGISNICLYVWICWVWSIHVGLKLSCWVDVHVHIMYKILKTYFVVM